MSENEYEEETKVVYQNNFFGTLITLIIGLLLGIILTVGGVIGAGYFAVTQPIDKTVNTVDDLAGTDVYTMLFGNAETEGILSSDYASKTVKALLDDITNATSNLKNGGSLGDLDNISPKVGQMVESLTKNLSEYAIELNAEELLKKPLKSSEEDKETLTQYLTTAVQNLSVGDLFSKLNDGEMSELLMVLCYGEKGVDYEINAEGKVQMLGNSKKTTLSDLMSSEMAELLGSVPVDAVLDISLDDDVMCSLAYGSSDRVYADENGEAKMKQIVYTLVGEKFYDDKNNEVDAIHTKVSAEIYALSFVTDETDENGNPIVEHQYVCLQDGKWLAFEDEAFTVPALYSKVKIGDLQGDAMSIIDNVHLKDALGITNANSSHNILLSLAYGAEGVDYKVEADGTITPITTPRTIGELRARGGDLINDIALSDIVSEDRSQPIVMYLLYGKQDVHYEIDGSGKLTMLQKRIAVLGDKAYNEYGEIITGYTLDTSARTFVDANGMSYKYGDAAIGSIATPDGTAELFYLTDMNGNPVKYTKTTLGDLAGTDNLISRISTRITIGELIEIDESGDSLLKHVKNETIETLPSAIEKLTIKQVFENKIYKKDAEGNYILDSNGDKVMEGSWWYLLHNEEDCKAEGHTVSDFCTCSSDYTLQEMDQLIENMKDNIHISTLNKLAADGMLNFGDGMLNSKIFTEVKVSDALTYEIWVRVPDENGVFPSGPNMKAKDAFSGKTKLGELTVEETIEYAEGLINVIEMINSPSIP